MTQHIKSVLIVFLLLSLSCSGNKGFESTNPNFSVGVEVTDESDAFVFHASFEFCDNLIGAFTSEEANALYKDKQIRLDPAIEKKSVDWSSVFYEEAKQCVEKELGEKHTSSYLYSTNDDFPFDNVVVFNDRYLITAQDGFFFVFKKSTKSESGTDASTIKGDKSATAENSNYLSEAYSKSKTVSLPIEYTYEFVIELNDFTTINSAQEIPELSQLSEFQFAKLPSVGKTKLLLVSGYLESGQTELHLLTLNDSFKVVDNVLLYTHRENEEGGVLTRFEISKDCLITITKEENLDGKTTVLEKKKLEMKPTGKFVKAK